MPEELRKPCHSTAYRASSMLKGKNVREENKQQVLQSSTELQSPRPASSNYISPTNAVETRLRGRRNNYVELNCFSLKQSIQFTYFWCNFVPVLRLEVLMSVPASMRWPSPCRSSGDLEKRANGERQRRDNRTVSAKRTVG